jgi:hypothetical protein
LFFNHDWTQLDLLGHRFPSKLSILSHLMSVNSTAELVRQRFPAFMWSGAFDPELDKTISLFGQAHHLPEEMNRLGVSLHVVRLSEDQRLVNSSDPLRDQFCLTRIQWKSFATLLSTQRMPRFIYRCDWGRFLSPYFSVNRDREGGDVQNGIF